MHVIALQVTGPVARLARQIAGEGCVWRGRTVYCFQLNGGNAAGISRCVLRAFTSLRLQGLHYGVLLLLLLLLLVLLLMPVVIMLPPP